MPEWLTSIGGVVLGVGGIIAAVVVFMNHVLTTRKLQLEIDALSRQLKDSRKTIEIPTPEQVEAVQRHLDAFHKQMAAHRDLLEAVTESEQSLGEAVRERAMMDRDSAARIDEFMHQLGSLTAELGESSAIQHRSMKEVASMVKRLHEVSVSLIKSGDRQADGMNALRVSLDRIESRMEGFADAQIVIRREAK